MSVNHSKLHSNMECQLSVNHSKLHPGHKLTVIIERERERGAVCETVLLCLWTYRGRLAILSKEQHCLSSKEGAVFDSM